MRAHSVLCAGTPNTPGVAMLPPMDDALSGGQALPQ